MVAHRGFGIFKLDQELSEFACPVCDTIQFELRNMGFVNCKWALKGTLKPNSKIFGDGQTYDGKLYAFKEIDFKTSFEYLNIFVKKRAECSLSNVDISSEKSFSSISGSDYGPSSRRVEENIKKSPKSPKSDDSMDFNKNNEGKMQIVKKDKSDIS